MWVTLESPSITEIAATMQMDWVVIDAEHGHLDMKEIIEHLRAARNSKTTALVRIQEIEEGLIKRVLDIGAEGILIPQVRSADDVERAVRFAKYPPRGIRGIGAERATRWGPGIPAYTRGADRNLLVIPIIENVDAERSIDEILEVPGVDVLFFGPADFAASIGKLGDWGGPEVMARILSIQKKATAKRKPCGILSLNPVEARQRKRQGFRMLGIGIDTLLMIKSAQEMMAALGRPVPKSAWEV